MHARGRRRPIQPMKLMRGSIVIVAVGVAMFSVGYLIGSRRQSPVANATSSANSVVSVSEERPVPSSETPPPDSLVESPVSTANETRLGALQALASLRDLHPNAVTIAVLARRDRIDAGFAALVGLSDDEVGVLNVALQEARNKLNSLTAEHARVSTGEDGTITVAVPPFEGGAGIYETLMDAFSIALGTERSDAFKKVIGEQLADAFHNFGAEQRTLTIASTLPGYVDWKDGGLYAKDERRTPSGKLETIAHRFWVEKMQYLHPHLRWIEPLLGDQLRQLPTSKP
jgi:hypothetical protein